MSRGPATDRRHRATRDGLRTAGWCCVGVGGVLAAIGFISFFSSFASFASATSVHVGPPRYFWCAFLGLPLVGVGTMLLRAGYAGAVAGYHAREYTPVIGDALNDLAGRTRPAQRAVRRLLREEGVARDWIRCPECGTRHRDDAAFCSRCGTSLTARGCGQCGAELEAQARFCTGCGAATA